MCVCKQVHVKSYLSFELTVVKLFKVNNKSLPLLSVYRVLFVSVTIFLEEIVKLFEILASSHDDVIYAGDVNIHMDEDEH